MSYIEPELREDRGEIEAALRQDAGKPDGLPKLVELGDIRGDLQCHTLFSDGNHTLEQMARGAFEKGYE